MAAKKKRALKYITRMDYNHVKGWAVRWSPSGEWAIDTKSKLFSDGVYGGKGKALKAAKVFRDKIIKPGELDKSRNSIRHHRKNSSGIIGVNYSCRIKNGGMYSYFEWSGSGHRNGKHWRRAFSINKYGEKGAFLWACYERYRRHGPLHIHCRIKDLPCRPDVPYVLHRKKKQ